MAKWFAPIFMLAALLALCAGPSMGFPVGAALMDLIDDLVKTHSILQSLANQIHELDQLVKEYQFYSTHAAYLGNALAFCGHHDCRFGPAYFDADNDTCVCPWGQVDLIRSPTFEDRLHPTAKCSEHIKCGPPLLAAFNPIKNKCVCSLYPIPHPGRFTLDLRKPNKTNIYKKVEKVVDTKNKVSPLEAEACATTTCVNNGDKPALFNPFSKTCRCAAPTFVDINDSAHIA